MTDANANLILNVDDNEGARYAKTRILSRAGFEVIEAGNGADAIERARISQPDLVLLDVNLPDLNGFEVCRRIKAAPETAGVLVIHTSAAAVASMDRVRGLEGGADSYLTEPIEPDELIAQVRALLRVRRAEGALRESEERFRQMAENIDDVFWMLDPASAQLLYVSPAYRRLWGDAAHEPTPTSRHWANHIHPTDSAAVEQAYRALATGIAYEIEYRIVRPDGETRWAVERAFPVRDARERIYRLAGIVNDISDRKANEMILRDADRRKDEFLAMLAHELRNPLAPIRNAIELLDPARTPTQQSFEAMRAVIGRQVKHLSRLVDDLLDVARITQGKITLRQEIVELSAALEAAIETVRPALNRKGHTLSSALPHEPVFVLGDSVRIAQVLGNVLSNAVKYTPPGGDIRVEVRDAQNDVLVSVRDNGVGIAAETLPHIFDLFVQSEISLERSEGGLGIGLPLARTLVELHGGQIEAFSAGPGRGSEFVVRLPLTRIERAARPAPAVEPAPPQDAGDALRVLLVDDSVDAALALSLVLQADGYDVRVAHEADSALELAAQFEPQVVLLDLGLPGMDGFQLAQEMRRRAATAGALLIAVTGYGQATDRQRSREAGFDHHLVKPVSIEEIQNVISSRFPAAHRHPLG
ncbi:hybrid sensor histidine kinase/response regulator [Burkholderia sp. SRS-W-2-2016]|uniref:hybrid sensor histidine kinase/response regulator n=1 Tax=Burkholderia sp. SRS-W-2-2016 TaxID=1926878 RepID=UPI00094AD8BC|nr:response regulator [Burkholderia sp. SRS-W-2-2016]OLL29127.1 hybrid sensor histidine kinase/response regulator [Burkholderia sp. SRS-W-2-2016]